MNRDTETVPARHETPDLAELRRLAEAATPGPWEAFGAVDGRRGERWLGVTTDMRAIESARAGDVFAAQNCTRQDALFIAAANPAAVLALLDAAADRKEIAGRLAHLLCDLTGGRMSKTSYPVPVMAQEIEQYLSECHESDLKDERDALAAAWDEGHQAGHEDARAVQSTYPEPTPIPYRAEGEPYA